MVNKIWLVTADEQIVQEKLKRTRMRPVIKFKTSIC